MEFSVKVFSISFFRFLFSSFVRVEGYLIYRDFLTLNNVSSSLLSGSSSSLNSHIVRFFPALSFSKNVLNAVLMSLSWTNLHLSFQQHWYPCAKYLHIANTFLGLQSLLWYFGF